ncbi:MAG: Unknown protein [uncultured Sulfurovum sp.]|uniref:Uncharacterized protein n=1 Tax=uncultured Sulfurovum sp. TaxID=269237 RepID=A0A6S6TW25_9BACT|nr:MAG: Unknown protein [uncultured Sulfurovum sp.]
MLFYVFYKKTKNHAVAAQLINGVLIHFNTKKIQSIFPHKNSEKKTPHF